MTGSPPYPAVTFSARIRSPRTALAASGCSRPGDTAPSADKVGLHDLGPISQLGHRALGEHSAVGHDDDRVIEFVNDGQFVLDHHDGHALAAQLDKRSADLAR